MVDGLLSVTKNTLGNYGIEMTEQRIFIFGLGYVGQHLAHALYEQGWHITGTTRDAKAMRAIVPSDWDILEFHQDGKIANLSSHLSKTTHIITTISALGGFDPVLRQHGDEIANFRGWVGYVSATSVYPDQKNGFVDETVPAAPATKRGQARLQAEQAWQTACQAEILRVAGIYGPGRNAIRSLLDGKARIIEKDGQMSNRIHQTDITKIIMAAIAQPRAERIINLCDKEPAAQGDVVRFAASLLGVEPPVPVAFEQADLTPMARSFYVSKRKLTSNIVGPELGVTLTYPTYREGLSALLETERSADPEKS